MYAALKRLVSYLRLKKKLKRTVKKRGTFSFRVDAVGAFLADLEKCGIEYCVLRWPDSVRLEAPAPGMSKQQVDERYGDVDLLAEIVETNLDTLLRVGSRHTSATGIRIDLYSTYGARGFAYLRFPYYPPLWARQLLAGRVRDGRGFYRLVGPAYIESLVYHVLYHKAAGIAGADSGADAVIAHYLVKVQAEASKESVSLPEPCDLDSLHAWLQARGFDMPFDLKVRWPLRAKWLEEVQAKDLQGLQEPIEGFASFCVFVLRDDLEAAGLLAEAERLIANKFTVRQVIHVPPELRAQVAGQLRGGNWIEGREGQAILPCTFLLCDDPKPHVVGEVIRAYPHLDNLNVLWKHELRGIMEAKAGARIYGVHSSDNHEEAMAMLKVLQDADLAG